MRLLAIATSPLQVQNIIRYVEQHGLDFADCVLAHVGSVREEDNERALTAARTVQWQQIARFAPFQPLRKSDFDKEADWLASEISARAEYVIDIAEFMEPLGPDWDIVVLGDYRPISFRQFLQFVDMPAAETVLVDDGSVSRYIMEYRATGLVKHEAHRGMKTYLGERDPFALIEPISLTFFTIYDGDVAQNDRIVANTVFDDAAPADFGKVAEIWLCGANHVEAKLAKRDVYVKLCRRLVADAGDIPVRYFPHRREDPDKIAELGNLDNVTVEANIGGIEQYVLDGKVRPLAVVTFGSTVADTLGRMFDGALPVLVYVPGEDYFTKTARTQHIRSIMTDNIRRNIGVFGVPPEAGGIAKLVASPPRIPQADGTIEDGWTNPAPPFEALRGLEEGEQKGGWTRILETEGKKGLHRAILGTVQRKLPHESLLHIFRVRVEERYAFKLRMAQARGGAEFVELACDLDQTGSYRETNDFGSLFVEVAVDADREAVVTVIARPAMMTKVELQLIALDRSSTTSSIHVGSGHAGFSIAPFEGFSVPRVDAGFKGGCATLQFAIPRDGMVFAAMTAGGTNRRVCLHTGYLNRLASLSLRAPLLGWGAVPIMNAAINFKGEEVEKLTSRAPSNSKGKGIRAMLFASSPVAVRQSPGLGATLVPPLQGRSVRLGGGALSVGAHDLRGGGDALIAITDGCARKGEVPFFFLF